MRGARPSPAVALALLALFAALAGSGYAAVKINGKNIKNRSIPGKKLKRNSVTGKEVNESRLEQVPRSTRSEVATRATRADGAGHADSATQASSATRATSAADVDTVKRGSVVRLTAAAPLGQTKPILKDGPFTLTANCKNNGGSPPTYAVVVTASSSEPGSFSAAGFPPPPLPATLGPFSSSAPGTAGPFDMTLVTPSGRTIDFAVIFGIKRLGGDCVTQATGIG